MVTYELIPCRTVNIYKPLHCLTILPSLPHSLGLNLLKTAEVLNAALLLVASVAFVAKGEAWEERHSFLNLPIVFFIATLALGAIWVVLRIGF